MIRRLVERFFEWLVARGFLPPGENRDPDEMH